MTNEYHSVMLWDDNCNDYNNYYNYEFGQTIFYKYCIVEEYWNIEQADKEDIQLFINRLEYQLDLAKKALSQKHEI